MRQGCGGREKERKREFSVQDTDREGREGGLYGNRSGHSQTKQSAAESDRTSVRKDKRGQKDKVGAGHRIPRARGHTHTHTHRERGSRAPASRPATPRPPPPAARKMMAAAARRTRRPAAPTGPRCCRGRVANIDIFSVQAFFPLRTFIAVRVPCTRTSPPRRGPRCCRGRVKNIDISILYSYSSML